MIQYYIKNEPYESFENHILPYLLHVCRLENESGKVPRAMHVHDEYAEIVYICEGAGVHMIGNHVYETKKGDILIYNRGVPHDERVPLNGSMCYFACGVTNLHIKGLPENCLINDSIEPVIHAGEYGKMIEALFSLLHQEVFLTVNTTGETTRYLMIALVTMVHRLAMETGTIVGQSSYELSQRIKNYIDEHYLENITLASIAENLGVSQYYLVRLFKEKIGYSPMQYIINRRIGDAQSMLISTDLPVVRIAERCGYDNANYFNLLFKKKIGMTPGGYRQFIQGSSEQGGSHETSEPQNHSPKDE